MVERVIRLIACLALSSHHESWQHVQELYVPTIVHMTVPDVAYTTEADPPATTVTTVVPVTTDMVTVCVLMLVTAAKGTSIAVVALGAYTVALTDRMLENSAVPVAVPFSVGCTVADPELTVAEPYQVDMFWGSVGAPDAIFVALLEPA